MLQIFLVPVLFFAGVIFILLSQYRDWIILITFSSLNPSSKPISINLPRLTILPVMCSSSLESSSAEGMNPPSVTLFITLLIFSFFNADFIIYSWEFRNFPKTWDFPYTPLNISWADAIETSGVIISIALTFLVLFNISKSILGLKEISYKYPSFPFAL